VGGEGTTGPFGSMIVLMLWMFITAYAFILGAEINAEVERQTRVDTTEGPPRDWGERGAFAADTLGPCRPPLGDVVKDRIDGVRAKLAVVKNTARKLTRERHR
ncbi:MAG: YhjD/YihY/BrkB family envelope integrity protein, partial [Myxococcota bacterium]